MNVEVSKKQAEILKELFAHCWYVIHDNEPETFSFYAQKCDKEGIKWGVQNLVAAMANDRANGFLYFSTLLDRAGIKVI